MRVSLCIAVNFHILPKYPLRMSSSCSSSEISSSEEENSEVYGDLEVVSSLDESVMESYAHPYAEEPIADAEWLIDYNLEREREKEWDREQYNRFSGVHPVDQWCKCGNCDLENIQNPTECICCSEIQGCNDSLTSELVLQDTETPPPCIYTSPRFLACMLGKVVPSTSCREIHDQKPQKVYPKVI